MSAELGSVVVKRYGTGHEDGELAEVVAVINLPTYELKDADGRRYTWVQNITRPATPDETTAYWQERARKAEEKLRASG